MTTFGESNESSTVSKEPSNDFSARDASMAGMSSSSSTTAIRQMIARPDASFQTPRFHRAVGQDQGRSVREGQDIQIFSQTFERALIVRGDNDCRSIGLDRKTVYSPPSMGEPGFDADQRTSPRCDVIRVSANAFT